MGFIIPFPFLLLNKSVHYSIPIRIRMVYSYEKEAFFGGGLYRRHTRGVEGRPVFDHGWSLCSALVRIELLFFLHAEEQKTLLGGRGLVAAAAVWV